MVNRRYSEYAASDSDTSKSTKFNSSAHDNCANKKFRKICLFLIILSCFNQLLVRKNRSLGSKVIEIASFGLISPLKQFFLG